MELEFEEGGSKLPLEIGSETQIGRELGLVLGTSFADRTISRRHLSLRLIDDPIEKFRVAFEVIGKNPILVCGGTDGGRRIYKSSEKGELRVGDKFSLSLKEPFFCAVRRREGKKGEDEERRRVLDAVERREKRTLERRREREERAMEGVFEGEDDEEIGTLDVSQIDPVKEFGFLVKGHEFDQYPKKKILHAKNWNWFLEEPSDNSDDDDDDETIDEAASSRRKKGRTRKKKGGAAADDEEWTGESEEEKVVVVEGGSTKRPKYSTRYKEAKRPRNDASGARNPPLKKDSKVRKHEVEEEDEEDEAVGGFIVDDEEEEEVVGEDDEESEEEFDDEEEDEDE